MTSVKDFNIEQDLQRRGTTITRSVFIPRYINHDDGTTTTLQDLGWCPNVEHGHIHLVHFCERCQCQRTFTIISEETTTSKKGREYVKGYMAHCDYCQENQ